MTIIEFYDKEAIENIAGALLCQPERVILIGDSRKQMEQSKKHYERILRRRGIATEIDFRSVNKNSLPGILEKLKEISALYGDCVFDLTGGDEMYLVAVGIMMEREAGRIQCHRFNFSNNMLYDYDAEGNICKSERYDISLEDSIAIYGGRIVTDPKARIHTYPWRFDDDFCRDIERMWTICRRSARQWNSQMDTISAIFECFPQASPLAVSVSADKIPLAASQCGVKCTVDFGILHDLEKYGLIRELDVNGVLRFEIKNEQVRRCLTVAGQILELYMALMLMRVTDKDGSPIYHDVRVGVVLDWNLDEDKGADKGKDDDRSINEIDIIAMKGIIPVFISCKNGNFNVSEFFKLNAVAEKFGGKYGKKVLIASELEKLGDRATQLRGRADDMEIRIVENVDEMPDAHLLLELRTLWSSGSGKADRNGKNNCSGV